MSKVERETRDSSQTTESEKKGIFLNDQIELLNSIAASQPPIDESHGWITYPSLYKRLGAQETPKDIQEMLAAIGVALTLDQTLEMSFHLSLQTDNGTTTRYRNHNSSFKIIVNPDTSPASSSILMPVTEDLTELNNPNESDNGYFGPLSVVYLNCQRTESNYLAESLRRQQDFGLALCSVFMPLIPAETSE